MVPFLYLFSAGANRIFIKEIHARGIFYPSLQSTQLMGKTLSMSLEQLKATNTGVIHNW